LSFLRFALRAIALFAPGSVCRRHASACRKSRENTAFERYVGWIGARGLG